MEFVMSPSSHPTIALIGGGNMSSAIVGGLLKQGWPVSQVKIIEPSDAARDRLARDFGLRADAVADRRLEDASIVVWAVKPQTFREAADSVSPYTRSALHLSVAAGVRLESIEQWLSTERVVRCMPNAPSVIGRGMTALVAGRGATSADLEEAEKVMGSSGATMWMDDEAQLDVATALAGSGPAYVFYFIEAMARAGEQLGLPPHKALRLATTTFAGSSELAAISEDSPSVLRGRVTSAGGTTHAAVLSLQASGVADNFIAAIHAAYNRAGELGAEFRSVSE